MTDERDDLTDPVVLSASQGVVVTSRPPLTSDEVVDTVLGAVAITIETLRTGLAGRSPNSAVPLDAALELTWQSWSRSAQAITVAAQVAAPLGRILVDPPLVPRAIRPAALANEAAKSWRRRAPGVAAATAQFRGVVVNTVVDQMLTSINLTELVIRRVDLSRVVTTTLAQLDLTDIVVDQVDLSRVATEVLDRIDLDKVARDRMDLIGIADYIVEGIDLPDIIRSSTGSMASETLRTVRLQSIDADAAAQRLVDRVLVWRRARSVEAPDSSARKPDDEGAT